MKRYLKSARVTFTHREVAVPLTIFGFTRLGANEETFELKPRRKRGEPEPAEGEGPPPRTLSIAQYYAENVRRPLPFVPVRTPCDCTDSHSRRPACSTTSTSSGPTGRQSASRSSSAALPLRQLTSSPLSNSRHASCVDLKEKRMRVPVELCVLLPGQPVPFAMMLPEQTAQMIRASTSARSAGCSPNAASDLIARFLLFCPSGRRQSPARALQGD
jgi:hypothetical protein